MNRPNDDDLFYVATIMEYTARTTNNEISYIADAMGVLGMSKVYEFADASRCLPFSQVADELIQQYGISNGNKEPDLPHIRVTAVGAAYANYVIEHQIGKSEYITDLFALLHSQEKMNNLKIDVAAKVVLERYRSAFEELAK